MKEYQARVIIEKKDLDARIERLGAFLKSPRIADLPAPALEQLLEQAGVMEKYSDVLRRRIESFDPVGEVATRATQIGPVTVDETGIDRLDVVLQHTLQACRERDARIAELEARPSPLGEFREACAAMLRAGEDLRDQLAPLPLGSVWLIPNRRGNAFRCADAEDSELFGWTTHRGEATWFARRGDAGRIAWNDGEAGEPIEHTP